MDTLDETLEIYPSRIGGILRSYSHTKNYFFYLEMVNSGPFYAVFFKVH